MDSVVPEVAPAPTLASVARQIGPRGVTDAVVPLALFLLFNGTAGIAAAVLVVTVWSLGLLGLRAARGQRTGVMLWLVAAYVAIRGGVSAALGSSVAFFGPGALNKALVGVAFLVSAAIGRPAVAWVANVIYPFADDVKAHPAYHRVFTRLTVAWGVLQLLSAALDIWLLLQTSTTTFLVVRAAFGWPTTVGLFAFSLQYPRRVFRREPELEPYVSAAEAGRRAAPASRAAS